MKVTVLFFAAARERAGTDRREVDLPEGATVAALFEHLIAGDPGLRAVLPSCRAAVDEEFAGPDTTLAEGAVVAVLPPVSGGSGGPEPFAVSADPLDVDALARIVGDRAAGAVVTFLGVSRETSPDARNVERPVQTLWYEAYGPMAVRRLREIGAETAERFDVTRVACHHRTGEVPVGEASVAIAVSAPHRGAAFDACRHVIEEIKRSLPVWKRERFADGEEWVEGCADWGEPPAPTA